jgi:hypothetical protein
LSSSVTSNFPELAFSVCVTLMNRDWSGEQVKVQKMLKKLSLHAGHDAIMPSASFKFLASASI